MQGSSSARPGNGARTDAQTPVMPAQRAPHDRTWMAFDDPNDAVAAEILCAAHPGRTVEPVDARDVFAFGGGIDSVTQQQPAPRTDQR